MPLGWWIEECSVRRILLAEHGTLLNEEALVPSWQRSCIFLQAQFHYPPQLTNCQLPQDRFRSQGSVRGPVLLCLHTRTRNSNTQRYKSISTSPIPGPARGGFKKLPIILVATLPENVLGPLLIIRKARPGEVTYFPQGPRRYQYSVSCLSGSESSLLSHQLPLGRASYVCPQG